MLLVAALAACLLQQTKPPVPVPPTPGSMLLMGQNIPLIAPASPALNLGDDVLAWPGWGPLRPGAATRPFAVDGQWAGTLTQWTAIQPDSSATTWRVKVFLLTDSFPMATDADGTLRETPSSLGKSQVERVLQSLVLAARAIEAQAGGHVKVAYDLQVDEERNEEDSPGEPPMGPAGLAAYVTPRINAGAFEANDHAYRGPYHLCLVIHPVLRADGVSRTIACLTPTAGISAVTEGDSVSHLATAIIAQSAWAASWWANRQGMRTGVARDAVDSVDFLDSRLWKTFGDRTPEQIAALSSFSPVNRDNYAAAVQAPPVGFSELRAGPGSAAAAMSSGATVTLVADPDKGQVLRFDMRTPARLGGFALPTPADLVAISKSPNHFLVFDAKTLSGDALGIGPVVAHAPAGPGVELGERPDPGLAASLPADGAWHKVAIDLSQIVTDGTEGLYVGNLPGQDRFERTSVVDFEYTFANFSLATAAPTDSVEVSQRQGLPWLNRVAKVRAALAVPALAANISTINEGLSDPDDEVRLNTLALLAKAKLPAFELKIAANLGNLDPRIVQQAIFALAALDTPTARQALDETLRTGSPLTRAMAATAVSQRKDPNMAGRIGAILRLRSWHVRLEGALAEAQNGGQIAQNLLAGMIRDDFEPDPAVRCAVVALLDPADTEIMRQGVLFTSVNDPSDAVRAAACKKLLECKDAGLRKEGYHGANDDSPWVRVQVLDYVAAHPSEEALPALRQAVTSPFGVVRAAALAALAASPSPVTIEDLGPAIGDTLPEVQLALIHLSMAKKVALPPEVVARLKASSDPNVTSEAAKLGS